MWRRRICILSFWFCGWFLNESRALSTFFGDNNNNKNRLFSSVRTTRFGMPAVDHDIPRYDHRSKPHKHVIIDCQCGRVRVSVPHGDIRVDPPPPPLAKKTAATYHAAVDCHCPSCRKYHVADRATYLLVPRDKVQFKQMAVPGADLLQDGSNGGSSDNDNNDPSSFPFLKTYADTCLHLGPVLRFQCAHCCTKLATQPQQEQLDESRPYESDQYFLNLAAVRDDSLPRKWTKQWRAFRFPWQYANQCVWTRARAEQEDSGSDDEEEEEGTGPKPYIVTGSCACRTYRYQVKYPSMDSASTELQHCYCQLCRRLSGGPFQTWMPVPRPFFTWMPSADASTPETAPPHEPPMHRYTSHGRRHVCDKCGGVMTIVYDIDGDEVVWPAAGGLDDATLPKTKEEMSQHLYGVCHICCRFRQSWYALPNDGYSRIPDAS